MTFLESLNADDLRNFYSHAREGRDFLTAKNMWNVRISTHTPARGVTILEGTGWKAEIHFYSHAREGRDAKTWNENHTLDLFVLTRPRGA